MTKRLSILFAVFLMVSTALLHAQVTTSALSVRVTAKGANCIGATVIATHTPSGTVYATVTNTNGISNLSGMRVGGSYDVKVASPGFQTTVVKGINLDLGQIEHITVELKELSRDLAEAVVVAKKAVAKNGSITNVGAEQLQKIPNISRSITDFTKLSPFAGLNNSFAGRDTRYNTITLDGAALNNNFGLSTTTNLPGGDAQPVSLDAVDAISVSVSPFDVKYSNFTGASVNVVTKSGTNEINGSVYTLQRPKSFTGDKVDTFTVANAKSRQSKTYGFTLGAPIIKNKLFIFLNGELEKQEYPGVLWSASTNGVSNVSTNTSRTTVADLETMRNYLLTTYKYDPGKYQDYDNFASSNWKVMGRVDWNINKANKFMVRFNAVNSNNDVAVNATSAPSGLAFGRVSQYAMAFSNSNYKMRNVVQTLTAELNSSISANVSNKLLATYTHIQDKREEQGDPFPFVDIMKDGSPYMSFGTELFTPHNNVVNNVLSFADNVNFTLDKHYITGGVSFDKMYFLNSYLRYPYGYYRYNSMADFMSGAKPTMFGLTYGYNGNDAPGAELNFGMGGAYLQDEWNIAKNFSVTGGLRVDLPMYFDKMTGNEAIKNLKFSDNGTDLNRTIDVSQWPASKLLFSPRLSFRWDVMSDRTVVISGGTGVFTGLLPFVWFTNQPTNAGVLQNTISWTSAASIPTGFAFNKYKDVMAAYPTYFPTTPNTTSVASGTNIAFVDPDFKMPQVWRSNLSADVKLPYDFNLQLNGMYTRDIYNVVQINVNEKTANSNFMGTGADHRAYFVTSADQKLNSNVATAMMLTNGKEKGYQYAFSAGLSKKIIEGLNAMVTYTYSDARDLTANPGSTASSAWSSNVAVGSLNNPGLSYSNFAVPHRVIASLDYELNITKYSKTTFSLFYSASNAGRISYTGSNDLNNDGYTADLIYVPASKDELTFSDITTTSNGVTTVTYSVADQKKDFWNYIENDSYLSSRKGKYAERYGALRPWLNRFDLKVAQNFKLEAGKNAYGLELSLNILNVGNMINSQWGINKTMGMLSYDNARIIKKVSMNGTGVTPVYQLPYANAASFAANTRWTGSVSTSSTWGMILGAKITF